MHSSLLQCKLGNCNHTNVLVWLGLQVEAPNMGSVAARVALYQTVGRYQALLFAKVEVMSG